MKNLFIYGCGSVGRMVEQIVFDINQVSPCWNVMGFIDDDESRTGTRVSYLPVIGDISALAKQGGDFFIALAFSSPRKRQAAFNRIMDRSSFKLATLVHPHAWVSRRVSIEDGTVIYPGVHIDVDVKIGRCVLLNKLCTVGHDTDIDDFCTAAPGVNMGGNCHFGKGIEFGINSATIQSVQIGEWAVIGGGAVVVRDIPANCTAVGVPARVIKQHA